MKEASGELNMTVITIVAIAAIAAFFYAFVWPGLQKSITRNQCAANWGVDATSVTMSDKCTCTCTGDDCNDKVKGKIENMCQDTDSGGGI